MKEQVKSRIAFLACVACAPALAVVFDAPSSVERTAEGWRAVYTSGASVKGNRFALENAPAGEWTLTADSWGFGHGDRLAANEAQNFPKVASASRFQFEVKGDADPKFGRLSVTLEPMADAIDPKLLRVVQQGEKRVFVDFGRETAVRGVYLPLSAKDGGVKISGGWNYDVEKGGGTPLLGKFAERDGRAYYEFHDVARYRYFALDGAVAASDVSFDVVPYGFTKHLTDETWEQKLARMKWWTDARFGLFIHFGLYAIPARHEWVKATERISEKDYDEYFKTFNPSRFDAKAWAKAAKDAGMKYAVITSRHHEGFSLFDTKFSDYKITNTPFGRDLIREFVEAFRAEGLKVGFYYSLLDWHHPEYTIDRIHPLRKNPTLWSDGDGKIDYSKENATRDMAKYRAFMKNQVTELLTNYGKIDIIWYDFSFPGENGKGRDDWDSEGLVRLTKRLQPHIIIDNRLDLADWEDGWDFATPEQNRSAFRPVSNAGRPVPWETCQTFSGSWGYHRDEKTWKSAFQCIEQLVYTVSKGGNVIMNVGPTARGEFDYRALERLADYGKWLKANGEAIYGCTAAPDEFEAPPCTMLTYNPETRKLYMHMLTWPFGTMPIPFGERVARCRLLNDDSELGFRWNTLYLPVDKPPVEIPVVEFTLK